MSTGASFDQAKGYCAPRRIQRPWALEDKEERAAMRKKVINWDTINPRPRSQEEWLDLEEVARVEVTSEDPNYPIEAALVTGEKSGWRAAEKGEQIVRIVFDSPRTLRRIRLEFSETEVERTQEFTLRWSDEATGPFREILRQQWSFSPQGSTSEVEDYQLQLENLSVLELTLKPDLTPNNAFATLARCRVA
jgi:hypothetical protein